MKKRLYKNKKNAVVCGVLGGVAEYFNLDPTIVRVIYVLLSLCSAAFPGIIIYIVLAVIMPDKSELTYDDYDVK